MTKKYIGQLLTFRFDYSDGTVDYSGYLIDFNDDWTLLKYNTVDYLVDGYIILNNKYIDKFKRDDSEKFKQRILDLKGQKPRDKERIPIADIKTILDYLTNKFGLFQFNMKTNKTCWLGTVNKITGTNLKIDYLTPKGTWTKTMPPFKLGNIRTIEFDTDYINSLKLIAKKKRK
jgi:hypothetical protein